MKSILTMPLAEPFFIPGGKIGCLLIHGFTGTPKEMRLLADSLALEKYTVLAPRLAGHATSIEDIEHANWQDWLASVEDGLNLLKCCTEQQVVMGLSMGGVLSLMSAARYDVKGVITFSTPCALPHDSRVKFLPYLSWLIRYVGKGKSDWQDPEAVKDHLNYDRYPTRAILQLKELIRVMRGDLPRVKVPALMVQSRDDQGVPAESMDTIYQEISSEDKTKMWIEHSGHVVIRDSQRELIFTAVKQFVKRITKRE